MPAKDPSAKRRFQNASGTKRRSPPSGRGKCWSSAVSPRAADTPRSICPGAWMAAGAAPPVLGWAAVTGEVHADALLLFLIVFVWTPPHFWSLAIAKRDDYAKVGILGASAVSAALGMAWLGTRKSAA